MRVARGKFALIPACSLAAFCATGALAQEVPQSDGAAQLGDIVVTAQRRNESLQKVPVSIAAISQETMVQKGVNQVQDIARFVPGLDVFSGNGSGFPQFTLRGIGAGSFNKNTTSTVAIYLDEMVLDTGTTQAGQLFDLQRIEVLNGPQGTLYGKNSTGGAINYITRRPDGSTAANASISVGRFGYYNIQAGAQTALTDAFSVRVSMNRNYSDGYGYNVVNNTKTNGDDNWGARVGIRYKAGAVDAYLKFYFDSVDDAVQEFELVGLNANGSRNVNNASYVTGFIPPPGKDVFAGTVGTAKGNFVRNRNYGATLNTDIDLDALTLTSISGYVKSVAKSALDADGSPFAVSNVPHSDVTSEQYNQELRLSSDTSGAFSWIAGANFFHKDLQTYHNYDLGTPLVIQRLYEKTTSVAGFFDATLRLGGGVSLIGGARLTKDSKKAHYVSPASRIGVYDLRLKESWTKPTWRAVLNYQANAATLLYASYSRGYRSGAFNNGFVSSAAQLAAVNPEYIDNFEGGLKTRLFDGNLRIASAMFYMKFRDQQLDAASPLPPFLCCTTRNVAASEIYGIESNGTLLLGDNFTVNYTANLIHGEFKKFQYTQTISYDGADLGYLPKYKVVLSPEYRVPYGDGNFFLAPDITFTGKSRQSPVPNAFGLDIQKSFVALDGQLGYRWGKGMSIFGYIRNVTNKRALVRASFGRGYLEKFYTAPRSFGLTVTAAY